VALANLRYISDIVNLLDDSRISKYTVLNMENMWIYPN
jgi:hypothetical protein